MDDMIEWVPFIEEAFIHAMWMMLDGWRHIRDSDWLDWLILH